MYKKWLFILSGVLLLMILTSCEEKNGIVAQPEVFSIQSVSVPSRINISRIKTYSISFKVTHPNGVDAIASVSTTFFAANQSDILFSTDLYDDGGVNNPGDMDVIARDGIFTNTFLSDSMTFPLGTIFVRAAVIDNSQQELQTDFIPCTTLFNKAPVLVALSAPDTLPSGSPPVLFSGTVQDSNGIEDVPSVIIRLKQQNLTIFSTELNSLNTIAEDSGLYGGYFDSTFAAERIGDYQLEFQAVDLSGDSSDVLPQSIYLENTAPRIFNISMRNTIQRPSSGADTMHVKISANDSQGLSDILSVGFVAILVGGDTSSFLPMLDDGDTPSNGDDLANDGRYSTIIQIQAQNQAGTYIFEFSSDDKVGNTSVSLRDTLEVLP
jgi:hypothetical protein